MREFEYRIDEALRTGLRPYKVPRNVQALLGLKNAKPSKYGIIPIEKLSDVHPLVRPQTYSYLTQSWPFPQYFSGRSRKLIGIRHEFFEVLSDGTLFPVIDETDNLLDDELWDVGDFGLYQIVVKDGSFVVTRMGDTGKWEKFIPHSSIPYCQTICNYRGQAVAGRLSRWSGWTEVGESYVAWSDIGSASFAIDRKGVAGYMAVGFDGPIYNIKRLSDNVIVYGRDGIGILTPVNQPMTTFGYDTLLNVGIMNKGAVSGDSKVHCFVSKDGYVYKLSLGTPISGKFSLKQLGYQEYINILDVTREEAAPGVRATTTPSPTTVPATTAPPTVTEEVPIIVSYVPGSEEGAGDFYISNGVFGFLLTQYGMAETSQRVSAAAKENGVGVGFFNDDGSDVVDIVTDITDFGMRGRKTVCVIEVGCSGAGNYSVALDYRYDTKDSFSTTNFVQLNKEGIATLVCAGTEFRIRLRYSQLSDVDISYITVRFKMDDLRGIRGVQAPPPRGQSYENGSKDS